MSATYSEDNNSSFGSMYSNDTQSDRDSLTSSVNTTIATRVPYGRKRSCWKKRHADSEEDVPAPRVYTPQKSVGEAGVITCAICRIQRYYKFIKQTKKFGLHSCEPCRKFVSNAILMVKNGERKQYHCEKKGSENCLLSEKAPVNNGTPRPKKEALSNLRCKACWLLMCLERYKMPLDLRNSLLQFIVEEDRPLLSTYGKEIPYDDVEVHQFPKRKSQTTEVKSCIKVLCDNYLQSAGPGLNEALRDSKKVVILRIKC